jgi:hypothetical protein
MSVSRSSSTRLAVALVGRVGRVELIQHLQILDPVLLPVHLIATLASLARVVRVLGFLLSSAFHLAVTATATVVATVARLVPDHRSFRPLH